MRILFQSAAVLTVPTSFTGLLVNRRREIRLCHIDPISCPTCMRSIARALAEELGFQMELALNKTTESYRAELGYDVCTIEAARELRRMTCAACILHFSREQRPGTSAHTTWIADDISERGTN